MKQNLVCEMKKYNNVFLTSKINVQCMLNTGCLLTADITSRINKSTFLMKLKGCPFGYKKFKGLQVYTYKGRVQKKKN